MNILDKTRLLQTSILSTLILGVGGIAYAQTTDVTQVPDAVEDEFESANEIVVTGSRIKRDTFTTTSPLQVLDGTTISEAGFLDLGDALRTTSVVQGLQLDSQLNSVNVTEAGPGGQSVGLRGLGPERTLILINGRRFAPAGIEGAPSFPDISLIPSSAIERNDILLDGASSVYGSDAIAGVINVILRDEFEGIEFSGQANVPVVGGAGGEEFSLDFIAGTSSENGSFVLSGEYFRQNELRGNDRDYFCGVVADDSFPDVEGQEFCQQFRYRNGVRTIDSVGGTIFQQFALTDPFNILLPRPGTTNPAITAGGPVDNFIRADLGGNFNGLLTPSLSLNQDVQLLPEFERFTLFSNAKVNTDDFIPGSEWFAEFSLSNRQSDFESPLTTFQFAVTPDNPFIARENFDTALTLPFLINPLRPFRGGVETELTQYRAFSGFTGDLGFIGNEKLSQWDYEVFAGYTRSQGFSSRPVVLEQNLLRSLDTELDADGNIVCTEPRNPEDFFFGANENLERCVPLNPFFPGLFGRENPVFEDDPNTVQDEAQDLLDFLQGSRTSTTFVDQKILGGYATGGLFDLPAGEVKAVIGAEWREDGIDTRSDDVTNRGLGQGFFRDLPSVGTVNLWELFGEVVVPLVKDKPLIHNLEIEGAARYVDHQFFGSNETFAGKVRYEPTDWLTFRATYGTSFRAPNLRDLFLQGQSRFDPTVVDPCEVPNLAQIDTDGDGVLDTYNPGPDADNDGVGDLDGRNPLIIANCQAINIDPFSLGIGINFGDVEVFDAGNQGLDPETSDAFTLGFTVDQPWIDDFDLQLGFTYWNIEINDAIFDPSPNFLVGSCITANDFPNNAFCTRQARGAAGQLIEVDATPFNIGAETAEGLDFNYRFSTEFSALGKNFDFSSTGQATRTLEDSTLITIGGTETFEDDAGTITSPDWRANAQQRLAWDDLSFFWNVRLIGGGEQTGNDIPVNCTFMMEVIDNCFATPDVIYNDFSITYAPDDWAVRIGLQNAFNREAPQIDGRTGGVAIDDRNIPLGAGYDRRGRTAFVNISKTF